jgi:hypothetical protein
MSGDILGWALVVLGIISTILGIAGGVMNMIKDLDERSKGSSSPPLDQIKASTELLVALIKAPTWLALTFIGFALIVLGGTMIN